MQGFLPPSARGRSNNAGLDSWARPTDGRAAWWARQQVAGPPGSAAGGRQVWPGEGVQVEKARGRRGPPEWGVARMEWGPCGKDRGSHRLLPVAEAHGSESEALFMRARAWGRTEVGGRRAFGTGARRWSAGAPGRDKNAALGKQVRREVLPSCPGLRVWDQVGRAREWVEEGECAQSLWCGGSRRRSSALGPWRWGARPERPVRQGQGLP